MNKMPEKNMPQIKLGFLRTKLSEIYADSLKQMCARLGHGNPRPLNRLQTLAFVMEQFEGADNTTHNYIVDCAFNCDRK